MAQPPQNTCKWIVLPLIYCPKAILISNSLLNAWATVSDPYPSTHVIRTSTIAAYWVAAIIRIAAANQLLGWQSQWGGLRWSPHLYIKDVNHDSWNYVTNWVNALSSSDEQKYTEFQYLWVGKLRYIPWWGTYFQWPQQQQRPSKLLDLLLAIKSNQILSLSS